LYGDFVWAREALNWLKWRFPARAVPAVAELHAAVRAIQRDFRARHRGGFPCEAADAGAAAALGREAVACSRPYLDVLQCDLAVSADDADATGSGGEAGLSFETLRRAQRVAFLDPAGRTPKDLAAPPYAATVAAVRARAAEALGVRAARVVFKPAAADLDAARAGETYLVSDRFLEPAAVHDLHGGCVGAELGGVCGCCANYIMKLLAREYGSGGTFRVYCERDRAAAAAADLGGGEPESKWPKRQKGQNLGRLSFSNVA
jgi:hypothetical protein